jgi:hypothetical protein
MGKTIWFITPAFHRSDVSEVVYAQRAEMLKTIKEAGHDAQAVVISDDENIDLAKQQGFATIVTKNDYLGRKWNEGYQLAAKEGADYVCPVGSDSWLDPAFIIDYLNDPTEGRVVVSSRHYSVVHKTGRRRGQFFVDYEGGTTMFFSTESIRHCKYRPVSEKIQSGCDGSTIKTLNARGKPRFLINEKHKLETVAFQTFPQITSYDNLVKRWGVGEARNKAVFVDLEDHYPKELVDRMRAVYKQPI